MKKTIKIQDFLPAKADFIANIKRRNPEKWESFNNELSLYCACFGLPVIVAITFAKEEFTQFHLELEQKELIVREFYGYE